MLRPDGESCVVSLHAGRRIPDGPGRQRHSLGTVKRQPPSWLEGVSRIETTGIAVNGDCHCRQAGLVCTSLGVRATKLRSTGWIGAENLVCEIRPTAFSFHFLRWHSASRGRSVAHSIPHSKSRKWRWVFTHRGQSDDDPQRVRAPFLSARAGERSAAGGGRQSESHDGGAIVRRPDADRVLHRPGFEMDRSAAGHVSRAQQRRDHLRSPEGRRRADAAVRSDRHGGAERNQCGQRQGGDGFGRAGADLLHRRGSQGEAGRGAGGSGLCGQVHRRCDAGPQVRCDRRGGDEFRQ